MTKTGQEKFGASQVPSRRRRQAAAVAFGLFILFVVACADRGALPDWLKTLYRFPAGDKVGHLLLIGGAAFLTGWAFGRRRVRFGRLWIHDSSLLIFVVAALEETSQLLVRDRRSFDLVDLAADILGIGAAEFALDRMAANRTRTSVSGERPTTPGRW